MVRLAARERGSGRVSEDARLRAESAQIDQLLEELRGMLTPPAWLRVEQVLRRVTDLYGAGLAHLLAHAHTAGAEPGTLAGHAAADELLASLLVLHGLHPQSAEERIATALAAVRSELELAAEALVLVAVGEDGVVHLRSAGALGGGAMSARVVEGITKRAIEAAAPEVTGVEIAGMPAPPAPGLVQLRLRREGP